MLRAARPEHYFDSDNPAWPKLATLDLSMPKLRIPNDEVRCAVAAELDAQQRKARAQVRSKGWTFLERTRLRLLSPFQRAKSWEPLRGRRGNPTLVDLVRAGSGQNRAVATTIPSSTLQHAPVRCGFMPPTLGEELQAAVYQSVSIG